MTPKEQNQQFEIDGLTELKEYAQFLIGMIDVALNEGLDAKSPVERNTTNRERAERMIAANQYLLYRLMVKKVIKYDNTKFHYATLADLEVNMKTVMKSIG